MKTPIRRLVTGLAAGMLLGLGCGAPEPFYLRVSSGTGGASVAIQPPSGTGGRAEVGGVLAVAGPGAAPAGDGTGGATGIPYAGTGGDAGTPSGGSTATGGAPEASGTGGGSGGDGLASDGGTSDGRVGGGVGTGPLVISVDFVSTAAVMASSEIAGVVRVAHWNAAPGGTGSLGNLAANDGAVTSAGIAWDGPGVWALGISDDPGNNRMMKGYLDPGRGQVATIKVHDLPSAFVVAGYDVYVYGLGDFGDDMRTYQYAIEGTVVNIVQGPNTVFKGMYTQATGGQGNYVIFRGLQGSSFTLTSTPGTALRTPRSPVNGLQIVAH